MANKVIPMGNDLPKDAQTLLLEIVKNDGEKKALRKRIKELDEREDEIFKLTRNYFGKKKTRSFVVDEYIFEIKKTGKTSVSYKELCEWVSTLLAGLNKKLYAQFEAKKKELTKPGEEKEAIDYTVLKDKKVKCGNCK